MKELIAEKKPGLLASLNQISRHRLAQAAITTAALASLGWVVGETVPGTAELATEVSRTLAGDSTAACVPGAAVRLDDPLETKSVQLSATGFNMCDPFGEPTDAVFLNEVSTDEAALALAAVLGIGGLLGEAAAWGAASYRARRREAMQTPAASTSRVML